MFSIPLKNIFSCGKKCLKIFGTIFFDNLNISVATVCKFRVCAETDMSIIERSTIKYQ